MYGQKKQAIAKVGTSKLAFTLVELIVVIIILAILGTIVFISMQGYGTSARDSTRVSDLSSMKSSLELFHLDAGNYPQTTDAVAITYSGAIVWNQGTFGETVFANVARLDKIPTEPLTGKEYTYSVTAIRNQYELGGMVEEDEISMNNIVSQTNAGDIEAQAYTTGNYNGQMTKSLSGTLCNVLALPSIITNDTSITDLQQIVASESLVYRGYKNLPASLSGSKFKTDGGFAFQPSTLVAYTDTSSCIALTDNTSYSARVELLKGLQDAYSGTIVQNEGELKNIMELTIDTNNPSSEVINYAGSYVNNTLNGNISTGGTPVFTNSNCGSGVLNSYNYGAIIHNQTEAVTKTGSLTNGVLNYGADALCTDGVVTIQNELTNIVCTSGFVEQAGACVADNCLSTVPSNAQSTATSQTLTLSWTHNTTPGACTFVCDNNYTWNGSSCVANTQSAICGGTQPANSTATAGTTYTQTWNGSGWSPTTSWGESQATCDFNCNSGYSWDGSSCVANTYPGCNTPNIVVGSYEISACNVGATTAGISASSYGNYFQWGNNGGTPSGNLTPSATLVNASTYGPGNFYNSTTFIGGASLPTPYDWTNPQNNNLWGNTTNTTTARQGPCASGYHVPSQAEWSGIVTAGGWGNNGINMMNALKLPMAGYRNRYNGNMGNQSSNGYYWSSSPSSAYAYKLILDIYSLTPSSIENRAFGYPVRCFKN